MATEVAIHATTRKHESRFQQLILFDYEYITTRMKNQILFNRNLIVIFISQKRPPIASMVFQFRQEISHPAYAGFEMTDKGYAFLF